jgi:hypothetical protein
VSLIDGSSAPKSDSGRKRRGDEHDEAIFMRLFIMLAIFASI